MKGNSGHYWNVFYFLPLILAFLLSVLNWMLFFHLEIISCEKKNYPLLALDKILIQGVLLLKSEKYFSDAIKTTVNSGHVINSRRKFPPIYRTSKQNAFSFGK